MFSSHLGHAQAVQLDRGVYLVCVDQLSGTRTSQYSDRAASLRTVDFAVSLHEQEHDSGLALARGVECLVAT